jgi:GT2 family glycosyltransferase
MRAAAVVVNHNGGDDVARCLAALAAQTVPVEVVLVDCLSTDGSRALAAAPPPGVTGVPLADNRGYAGGCAAGLAALAADVEVVGFLNPDCFAAPDLFERCIAVLSGDHSLGGVAPRLERPGGELLDSCGQVLTPVLLRVRDRGYGERAAAAYPAAADVLAVCGAAMVYRRAALDAAAVDGAVFPVEYFAFWEDLDLGWRVSNAGWRVRYEPSAVAVHRRGATAAPGRGRLTLRRPPHLAACILVNRWATLLRNLHRVDFVVRLPVLLLADAAMVTIVVALRPRSLPALARELRRLRLAWRQRRRPGQRRRLAELP